VNIFSDTIIVNKKTVVIPIILGCILALDLAVERVVLFMKI